MNIPSRLPSATVTLPAEPVVKFQKPVVLDPNSYLVKSLFPSIKDILPNVPRPNGPEPKPIESAQFNEILSRMMIR